jgi:hypothetical protein
MADEEDTNSLELFTDPVCNIFGTFCFLVILLGFMSVVQGDGIPAPVDATAALPTPEQRHQQVVGALREQLDASMSPQQAQKQREVEALRQAVDRRRATQAEANRREDSAVQELSVGTAPQEAMKAMIPMLQSDIARLEQALRDANARNEMRMSLPSPHSVADADVVPMILDGGRLYLVNRIPDFWQSKDWCRAFETWEPACVDVAASSVECGRREDGMQMAKQRIALKKDGGVAIRDADWQQSPLWLSWMKIMRSSKRVVVYLHVAADSHGDFPVVRRAILAVGMNYDIAPIEAPFELSWIVGTPTAQ